MRPLPSISLIKSKLLSLSLSIYLSLFHSFFFSPLRVKRMTCHYQSTPSLSAHCLSWFYMSDMEVGGWSQGHFEPSIDLLVGIKGFCLVLFCLSVKVMMNLAVVGDNEHFFI